MAKLKDSLILKLILGVIVGLVVGLYSNETVIGQLTLLNSYWDK